MDKLSKAEKLRSALQIMIGGHVVAGGMATYFGHEGWYKNCIMPFTQLFGAETAHRIAVTIAKYKMVPRMNSTNQRSLNTQLLGQRFSNPIGLAAGFDKGGEAVDGLLKMGFGFVEVGSVTPEPQDGNQKPRVFRLKEDKAVINRYGFNSEGHEVVLKRVEARTKEKKVLLAPDDRNMLNENIWSPDRPTIVCVSKPESGVVGINLGKNKTSPDAVGDYVKGVKKFGHVADYLVINISSPNTPGLRDMQGRQQLQELVDKVVEERDKLPLAKKPPLLVKIAPDLTEKDKIDIAAVVESSKGGISGLIVTNTTISRPNTLKSSNKTETGGLSGAPLKDMSTEVISDMYKLTRGTVPIIGVGGVSSGQDAYEKICAGASLVQLYTGIVYEGPPLVRRIKTELNELLVNNGFERVSEAVGCNHSKR